MARQESGFYRAEATGDLLLSVTIRVVSGAALLSAGVQDTKFLSKQALHTRTQQDDHDQQGLPHLAQTDSSRVSLLPDCPQLQHAVGLAG